MTVVWSCKGNGYKKVTEMGIRIKIERKEAYGGTQNKMVYPGFFSSLGAVRLSPLGTLATVGLLYQPRMIDDDDYGAVGGMRIGRENRRTLRNGTAALSRY
jgi:hypothetical protein